MNGDDGQLPSPEYDTFAGMDTPRIRHITGLRIHQLSLPGPSTRPSSAPPLSPEASPRRPAYLAERSISSSTITHRSRAGTIKGRERAPTLAGEALEHAKEASTEIVQQEVGEAGGFKPKRLARTFVTLRLPAPQAQHSSRKGKEKEVVNGHGLELRPALSTSSSRSSGFSVHSSQSPTTPTRSASQKGSLTVPHSKPDLQRSSSASSRQGSKPNGRPRLSSSSSSTSSIPVPFFISPIHQSSTHPQFLALDPGGDFAPWISVEEAAGSQAVMEVWYEDSCDRNRGGQDGDSWVRASATVVDLAHLRRVDKTTLLEDNTLLFTLSSDPRSIFYLPSPTHPSDVKATQQKRGRAASGVIERSQRETRMRKGVGLGGLHQLVNMQAVIADTQRSIAEVQRKIDMLLKRDVDGRAIRRDVSERKSRVRWFNDRIAEVDRVNEEVHARITLRRQDLAARRTRLDEAEMADHSFQSRLSDLATEIHTSETDRLTLQPAIHHTRSQHVQTLDSLFPISPLHAPSLLYSILDIPLPIPLGPKDPAPPLMMNLPESRGKVDEKSTAAALGYVAMVVSILGNLSPTRKEGGLSYPITCAGSRSLVKDTVSVMQGPRSFPLFAKGVERYRYEYAVFLLNKNIEMLMQEASIRLLDIRHTLPNLKALLLTLSSPIPPPARRAAPPPMSSRQTSQAYSIPHFSPTKSIGSPSASASASGTATRVGSMPVSPVGAGRRSRLSRGIGITLGQGQEDGDDSGDEKDSEAETATATGTELDSLDPAAAVTATGSSVVTSP